MGEAPLTVNFVGNATDVHGIMNKYAWSYKKSNVYESIVILPVEQESIVVHANYTYNEPNQYSATFTAWNEAREFAVSGCLITVWTPLPTRTFTPAATKTPSTTQTATYTVSQTLTPSCTVTGTRTPTVTSTRTPTATFTQLPGDLNADHKLNYSDWLVLSCIWKELTKPEALYRPNQGRVIGPTDIIWLEDLFQQKIQLEGGKQ